MKTSRHLLALAVVCGAALAAGGCAWLRPEIPPVTPTYTAANPGPWTDIKVSTSFAVTKTSVSITVKVEGYPTRPGDSVRRFELIDDLDRNVGDRVFEYGADPQETFDLQNLQPVPKQVTVTVMSTSRGQWRCEPQAVPAFAEK